LVSATDYYSFGMPMPGRRIVGGYRYQYQGQEVDPETGKEAFQLRLWDGRIGRWLTTDPYGQHASPYLGMGNNPISRIDPDGGLCVDANNNTIPCPDGYGAFSGPTVDTGVFDNGEFVGYGLDEITITSSKGITPSIDVQNSLNFDTKSNAMAYFGLALGQLEKINIGQLKKSGDYRIYYNNPSGSSFKGNQYVILHNVGKYAKIGGNIFTAIDLVSKTVKVATTTGHEQEMATQNLTASATITGISMAYPPIGIVFTVGTIMTNTDAYKEGLHNAKVAKWRKNNLGPHTMPQNLVFKQRN